MSTHLEARLDKFVTDHKRLKAHAQLHQIGNQEPYFSLTGEEYEHGRLTCCGCMHVELVATWPELQLLEALHLSTKDGMPMHAVENGWYWAGGCKEWCQGKPGDPPRADYLASHLRVAPDVAKDIIAMVRAGTMSKADFAALVEQQKPRWAEEAKQGIALLEKLASQK